MRVVGDQAGEVADQAGRAVGVGAQLGDDRGGLVPRRSPGPSPASRDPMRDREVPVDHGIGGCSCVRPYAANLPGTSARAVAGGEGGGGRRRGRSRASRVVDQRDPVGDQRRRSSSVPSRSVATPARPLTPVRVPVLARTRPRPARLVVVEAVRQRAGEAGDRQPGQHGPQLGVVGGRPPAGARRPGWPGRAGCPGRARCRRTARRRRSGYAEPGAGPARRRRPRPRRSRRPTVGQPDVAGQHLGGLVVADREHPLDDLRRAARSDTAASSVGARAGPCGVGRAGDRDARPRRAPPAKYGGRRQRGVGDAAGAGGRSALVDPERA